MTMANPSSDLTVLLSELSGHGTNYAPIPVAAHFADNMWTVFAEARIDRDKTFDVEATAPELTHAVRKCLTQLRRQLAR